MEVPYWPVVVCFPPSPPPLDSAVSHAAYAMPQRFAPPTELAAYVNAPFYAPLSTWLLEGTLADKMRQLLNAWQTARANALADLRSTLEQVRNADPATRRHTLETFARQQTPSLVALERDAEQIRSDLAIGSYDWRAQREWSLGQTGRRGDSPREIGAVMRAYAYYQSGLSPAQRRLLREIALELAFASTDATSAEASQPYLFFSPEPARVLLSDNTPADLAAKIAAYQTKKSALKKELYDAVYKQDSANFSFMRAHSMKSLAEGQAARLAELDTLAEDIRRGLAELPSPTRALYAGSALPPVLTARLDTALEAAKALQKETTLRIDDVRLRLRTTAVQLSYSFESDGLKFTVAPRSSGRFSGNRQPQLDQLQPQLDAAQTAMADIAADYGRRFAELINEWNAIRRDAAAALGNPNSRAVDAAFAAARNAAELKNSEDAYREYRLAVFEPGMSPEQRRLLFGGAIEMLDLPLPRGEFQPVQRAADW